MKGFRVSVYWEEVGTIQEGGMNDERQLTVTRKPTGPEMTKIENAVEQKLKELGLVAR